MGHVMPPSGWERKIWEEKQRRFREKCRQEDAENQPKNMAEKIRRAIWRLATCPRDPRIY